jgi:hypothetical protein
VITDLANAALADARANKDRFYMGSWVNSGNDYSGFFPDRLVKQEGETVPPCGTTACFGGFVLLRTSPVGTRISNGVVRYPDGRVRETDKAAGEALDLTAGQADVVFYLSEIDQVEQAVALITENPSVSGDDLLEALGLDPEDW